MRAAAANRGGGAHHLQLQRRIVIRWLSGRRWLPCTAGALSHRFTRGRRGCAQWRDLVLISPRPRAHIIPPVDGRKYFRCGNPQHGRLQRFFGCRRRTRTPLELMTSRRSDTRAVAASIGRGQPRDPVHSPGTPTPGTPKLPFPEPVNLRSRTPTRRVRPCDEMPDFGWLLPFVPQGV